jgi:ABC-type phosphate transport system substrate-binding protein
MIILLYIFLVLLQFGHRIPGEEAIVVIVHESVKTQDLTQQQLVDIYTLNAQNWGDGKKIVVTDFKGDGELREKFYSFLAIKPNEIKRIWLRKQFSGSGTPPLTVSSEEEMIERVIAKPGTIGYVTAGRVPPKTRVVATIN